MGAAGLLRRAVVVVRSGLSWVIPGAVIGAVVQTATGEVRGWSVQHGILNGIDLGITVGVALFALDGVRAARTSRAARPGPPAGGSNRSGST